MTAAVWSAVAAIFAAASSFMIFLTQRRVFLESVRPELVLTDWERHVEGDGVAAHEVLSVRNIRNVGRGAAMHVHINVDGSDDYINVVGSDDHPTALLESINCPILAPNEKYQINAQISVWWKNVTGTKGEKFLPINLEISCMDSGGSLHRTQYTLVAFELSENVYVSDTIAPGVILGSRYVKNKPIWFWLLKLSHRVQPHWARVQKHPQIAKAKKLTHDWWVKLKRK